MSSTTFSTSTPRHARPGSTTVSRVRQFAASRRESVRGRRELDAILAGHHGVTMRDEMLAVLGR